MLGLGKGFGISMTGEKQQTLLTLSILSIAAILCKFTANSKCINKNYDYNSLLQHLLQDYSPY